MYTLHIFYY